MDFDLQELWNEHSAAIIAFALNLLLTFVILIVGLWVIKRLVSTLRKILTKKNVDPTLIPTLLGVVKIGLTTVLLIAVVKRFGADTAGLVAILGGLSLALGLALQGSLGNFAGGMLILTLKPFKAGDFVEVNGESGTV
ncbi:MAG: mechanosensitive ion channel, partial [Roseivirga sp.]|nr:mechanosensitive ion channel [Roseivirga sp.]